MNAPYVNVKYMPWGELLPITGYMNFRPMALRSFI
jgi:hypothetical protein